MNYLTNCIFIDEAAFHINMKKNFAWSKKNNRAEVAKAKTMTILGTVSPLGIVSMEVKRPKFIKVNDVLKELLSSSQTTASFFLRISTTWLLDSQDSLDKRHPCEVDVKAKCLLNIHLFCYSIIAQNQISSPGTDRLLRSRLR
ncbi:hypothetical protein BCV72DRAFT_204112 [Rhizopus microsporus var. microsporus]|uniref:Uncharacterized protein n=1 Tax=Rhizopus microsporus var. microsporus TaxID=86635 RepID=A0A1X0R803_RHIZD|nr:hypothetical protein BCV72DRAFT_204112 [Rhizopus microsporus var. microsporus]